MAVERAGLSIEELANRIGCSRALIYQYLSGSTLAQPDRLQQIAAHCAVPLTFFYAEGTDTLLAEAPSAVSAAAPAPQEVTQRLTDSLHALQELADAQSRPPDYRALAATCERILSIASQLGDRAAQTRAQLRLGNALLFVAEFARASDSLLRAVTLAVENGDAANEAAARQSLGNALQHMGRFEEAREQFQIIASGSDFTGRWQGTLSLGSLHEQRGEYKEAMQRFDETAAILEQGEQEGHARPEWLARGYLYLNTNRRNVYMDGGDFQGARALAEKGLADAESQGNADQHLEARFDLAWCDFQTGRWQAAYHGLAKTLQLARFVGDQGRESMTRAWLGIFLSSAGDHNGAIEYGKDALAKSLSRGDRRSEMYAQLALADAYTGGTRRESEAAYHAGQAIAIATALRQGRQEAECRLRLARLSVGNGEWQEAKEAAGRALSISIRLGARHIEAAARLWLAEALYREAHGEETAEESRRQAGIAHALAEEIGLTEIRWRTASLLARLSPEPAAEKLLHDAVVILDSLRNALTEAGIPDTLLENSDCAAVYIHYVVLVAQNEGGRAEAAALLEQIGWPPLLARIESELKSPLLPT